MIATPSLSVGFSRSHAACNDQCSVSPDVRYVFLAKMSRHFQSVRLARAQRCRHMQTTGVYLNLLLPTIGMAGLGVCIYFRKLQNLAAPGSCRTPVAAGHTRNP